MIQVRDGRRGIDEAHDTHLQVDEIVLKASMMERHGLPRDSLHIPVSKGYDYTHFMSKEFPRGLPDEGCSRSPSVDCSWPAVRSCGGDVGHDSKGESWTLMPFVGFTTYKDCPATRALELVCNMDQRKQDAQRIHDAPNKKMIQHKSLKRDRSSLGQFDLADLLDATQPVEDSISFPSIEWNFDDEDEIEKFSSEEQHSNPVAANDDGDDPEDLLEHPRAKRHCRGLVRSREVAFDLHHLEGIS